VNAEIAAITDLVAPVVLVLSAGIIVNALLGAYTEVAARLFAINQERLSILTGPDGEIVDLDTLPGASQERMAQIEYEIPLIVRRVRRLRLGALLAAFAICLFVAGIGCVAVTITAPHAGFGWPSLGLILAGVFALLLSVLTTAGLLVRSADALLNEVKWTHMLR
jgi:hypothetical protein